jgi:lipopolysaccharide transport system ATP-binding protein
VSADEKPVILQLKDVSLSYHTGKTRFERGLHRVLHSVSLSLFEGETLGVIGRNGVGKSTILRVIARILAPTSGSVSIQRGKSSALLSLGLGFRPDLSGRDNALLSAMLQGSSQRQARSYLEEIKEFSALGDSFEEPVKTYSSGMKSRLGFTTALMTHVDILLIDEVLAVGDAEFKKKTRNALQKRIRGEQTVVLVSHSESQISKLCDRAIWIEAGEIVAEGDTEMVLEKYNSYVLGDSPK